MFCYSIDWESFYGDDYTLTKLSTADYIAGSRFQEIGVTVQRDDGVGEWFSSPRRKDYAEWFRQFEFEKHAMLSHNINFDGLIMAYHYDIRPALYLDTLAMARPILRCFVNRFSLASCVKFFKLGEKGDEVVNARGKRLEDFTPEELMRYAEYCKLDASLTRKLYLRLRHHMRAHLPEGMMKEPDGAWPKPGSIPYLDRKKFIQFPDSELRVIDKTARMYLDPSFTLNRTTLDKNLVLVQERKQKVLAEMEVQGITAEVLRSAPKFAALLESKGVEVPLKPSPADIKNGVSPPKMVPAFSKTDEAFKKLQEEYADTEIEYILNARISEKSTQEETRTKKFIGISENHPYLRVELAYGSAHTWRYGGAGGTNMQNPANVDKSPFRYSIEVPDGYVFVNADQAQIEARLVSTVAGQWDLVEQFRRREDVYSNYASEIYKRPVDRKKFTIDAKGDKFFPDLKEGKVGKEGILGLGFGMGGEKFRITLAGKAGVIVDILTATGYVEVYRGKYSEIPKLWRICDYGLRKAIESGGYTQIGDVIEIGPDGIRFLYNDTLIAYPKLRNVDGELSYRRAGDEFPRKLFGGKVTENFIQKLARDIVMDQAITVHLEAGDWKQIFYDEPSKQWVPIVEAPKLRLQNHDALVYAIHEDQAEDFGKVLAEIMGESHRYCPRCPLEAEVKIGRRYGDV